MAGAATFIFNRLGRWSQSACVKSSSAFLPATSAGTWKLIAAGLTAMAGVSGAAVAARLAAKYGLVPPDAGGPYGVGATLNYAAHRLLTRHTLAREFPRHQISRAPFANGKPPEIEAFKRSQAGGFADWGLTVDGLVAHPRTFSVAELKGLPARSQITQIICEEGWSYVAEWIGTPLSQVLKMAGMLPEAKFIVYYSIERQEWWDSIDIAEALHPQAVVAHGFNAGNFRWPSAGRCACGFHVSWPTRASSTSTTSP